MIIDSNFWGQIKAQIKSNNENNKLLDHWLDPIDFIEANESTNGSKIVLGAPTPIQQYFAIENLKEKIHTELLKFLGQPVDIEIIIHRKNEELVKKDSGSGSNSETEALESQFLRNLPQQPTAIKKEGRPLFDVLSQELTFSSFVVGKNSEFAHAAWFNVAKNPGTGDYNPLYIYGPVGMGKTHLLHASGNHIRENFPHLRILYISAERFLNECISSIRRHEMDKFRQKYRDNCDILLVDDVQYIARGEAVQEEFFHTLYSFIDLKKQIILASDRMPKDIHGLEDRSRTRLERGLIADITMPDLETRIAILRYKAEKFNVPLSDEVANYIARISKRSIREVEGNLKKIKMFSELQGLPINLELAKKILSHHESQTSITLEEIQKMVADHFKIRLPDLKSSVRAKQIVVPRQISMFLIKKFLDKSLVEIGRAFGGKDHTTVMNAIERVHNLQLTDQNISKDIEDLETRIHNITGV